MPRRLPKLPACRDPNDQMFLSVASVGQAEWLVSGDRDLLALAGKLPFRIVAPAEFLGAMA
jgi:predicted nucleic acid-binding protein